MKMSLNETNEEIRVTADGKIQIEATGDIEIKVDAASSQGRTGVSSRPSGQVKIKGATVALN